MNIDSIISHIVDVPDFPKAGVVFKDITPVLENPQAFNGLISLFAESIKEPFDAFAAIESRGFILGAALATKMNKGLILVRKPGKLPREVGSETYDLEYGSDEVQAHKASFAKSPRVVIIDDVLATGGTASATESLCEKLGGEVVCHRFMMQLNFLKGFDRLKKPHLSLIELD